MVTTATSGAATPTRGGTAGLVKGLTSLFHNPKQHDSATAFPDLPPTSSLTKLKIPFSHETDDTFQAMPGVMDDGCYLLYDNASGGTLVLHYSHHAVPENAIGFWQPGVDKTIQSWKYDRAGGYTELLRGIVGGTQNNRRYYNGWCQFVQLAKSMKGRIKIIDSSNDGGNNDSPGQNLPIDLYGYMNGTVRPIGKDFSLVDVTDLEAIACVPRNNDRFKGVKTMDDLVFMQHGNLEGSALKLHL
jgi:hypothetical protein